MTARIGYKSYVGFGLETSLATAAQPTTYVEYNSESFQKEITEQVIEAINGTRVPTKRVTMEESVGGSFEVPMVPLMELTLFKHLSGWNFSTTALSTGAYVHTFKIDNILSHTSLTFQVARDTANTSATYNYTGCKVNSAGFNVSVGGLLMGSFDVMGVNMVGANTIGTASYGTNNPYTFKEATIAIGSISSVATTVCVDSWSCSINQALIEDRCLGSALRDRIEPGMAEVTGEISMRYEDESMLNYFLNKSRVYISATFDSGVTIGATTATHKIVFKTYKSYFNGTVPNVGGASEILKHSMPYRAIREDSSVGALVIEVTSSQETP
jgi:hypothetical protein